MQASKMTSKMHSKRVGTDHLTLKAVRYKYRVLEVKNISKTYGTGEATVHALKDATFSVPKGEFVAVVGESGSGKSTLLNMTGSFALTIMLFLTFSACLDIVHKPLPSVSDFTPDITIASQDDSNSIDPSLAEEISEIPGIESVFGMMYSIECPAEINGNAETVDLYSYGDTMMDSFKKSVISGDMSKIYGNSKYVLAVYSEYTTLNVGDKVKIGDEELEIGCVVSEGVGSVSGSAVVVCSEETYTRLTGEQDYAMVGVVLEKDVSEMAVNKIYDLAEGNIIADSREKTAK